VCAYDRPGAPHLDQTFSRSDPVPQPTSPQNGVNDLVALLKAADVPGPYVLVAHSFSGTIAIGVGPGQIARLQRPLFRRDME
jgi:pimeloyl-ACP methyl ester carboxylesterase